MPPKFGQKTSLSKSNLTRPVAATTMANRLSLNKAEAAQAAGSHASVGSIPASASAAIAAAARDSSLAKPQLHDKLGLLYLQRIQQLMGQHENKESRELNYYRDRLRSFLTDSRWYTDKTMYTALGEQGSVMNQERAIVLGRMGQHDSALKIYAQEMRDLALAEQHCLKYWNPNDPDTANLFFVLLRAYLDPQDGNPQVERGIELLKRHPNKVDVHRVLDLLPPSTSLANLLPYLQAVLEKDGRTHRDDLVIKQLLAVEMQRLQEKLIVARGRRFRVDAGRQCPVCKNRIGESVFALYPNDVLVHYSCMRDKSTCPATGTVFTVKET